MCGDGEDDQCVEMGLTIFLRFQCHHNQFMDWSRGLRGWGSDSTGGRSCQATYRKLQETKIAEIKEKQLIEDLLPNKHNDSHTYGPMTT